MKSQLEKRFFSYRSTSSRVNHKRKSDDHSTMGDDEEFEYDYGSDGGYDYGSDQGDEQQEEGDDQLIEIENSFYGTVSLFHDDFSRIYLNYCRGWWFKGW